MKNDSSFCVIVFLVLFMLAVGGIFRSFSIHENTRRIEVLEQAIADRDQNACDNEGCQGYSD